MGAPTTNMNLAQPDYQSSRWDQPLNANFVQIDNIIGGTTVVNVTGLSGGVYLTKSASLAGGANSALCLRVAITGTPTADTVVITPPNMGGAWIVVNWTSGGKNIYFGGTDQTYWQRLPQGTTQMVYSDGSYATFVGPAAYQLPQIADIKWSGTNWAQSGWLLCDGSWYNIATFPALAQRIGNRYGGDGSTTFAVPQTVGYVMGGVGQDGNSGSLPGRNGYYAGAYYVGLAGDQNGYHAHDQTPHAHGAHQDVHSHYYEAGDAQYGGGGPYLWYSSNPVGKRTDNQQPGVYIDAQYANLGASGSGNGHVNVQPTVLAWAFIYAGLG